MGQKIHPLIFRIGFIKDWKSLWFADKHSFPKFIKEDALIRRHIQEKLRQAAISRIIIERVGGGDVRIKIYTARPGIIIGRHGADIDQLKQEISKIINRDPVIDVIEVKQPSLDAQVVSQNIAFQLEKRIAFRRATKRAIDQAMANGAKGIKVCCAGRLGGAEIARREKYKQGKIPLQTFRADVDYGFAEAHTTYGLIGVKTWIYKGEVLRKKNNGTSL